MFNLEYVKLSTRSLYGLRMLFHITKHYQMGPLQLSEIANREGISEKYLGQIVLLLRSSGILSSVRGNQGGYLLARAPSMITILQVVECLEGGNFLGIPDNDSSDCQEAESDCAVNEVWSRLKNNVLQTLGSITLEDLINLPGAKEYVIDFAI